MINLLYGSILKNFIAEINGSGRTNSNNVAKSSGSRNGRWWWECRNDLIAVKLNTKHLNILVFLWESTMAPPAKYRLLLSLQIILLLIHFIWAWPGLELQRPTPWSCLVEHSCADTAQMTAQWLLMDNYWFSLTLQGHKSHRKSGICWVFRRH